MSETSANEVLAGGRNIRVRGLTRRELRLLSEEGFNPALATMAKAEATYDKILGVIVAEDDLVFLEDQCNAESLKVYKKIMDLTYGRKDEEKNS